MSVILTLLASGFASPSPALAEKNQPLDNKGLISFAGPLRVSTVNPRYFTDDSGKAILLSGSHTWANFQDISPVYPPAAFDYDAYLSFLQANNHNFFRLWMWEEAKWVVDLPDPYYFSPLPYARTGPGTAGDGQPKFDLTQFNQAYFDRMRERIIQAGNQGVYVSVMLFDGWSISYPKGTNNTTNPWSAHPYNLNNNINGINGDPNGNNSGDEVHTLQIPAVTALQEAYVAKVIDTVNDLDNVLYEISNESPSNSQDWQYHMINYIKGYEATQPKQHPVGMTVEYPNGDNAELFNGPADWVSPNEIGGYKDNPPVASGLKVILNDTDHLWGSIGGDRQWAWKSFTRGMNPIFMDCYNNDYCLGEDPNSSERVSLRSNLGYIRNYANRMNLVAMTPQTSLCSTGYCLANPVSNNAEYLVYLPNGGNVVVDLSAASGTLNVEWLNPQTGVIQSGGSVAGGNQRTLITPFSGDSVLYISDSALPTVTPGSTLTATITSTPSNTPTATSTRTPSPNGGDIVYLSSAGSGTVSGVTFADEDILAYDKASGSWSLYFDGSDVGLSAIDVNAFALMPDNSILLSFDAPTSVSGLGTVDDSDIVRFIPTSLGDNTSGTFEWYFDGSDVGLTTNGEDIDAIDFAPNGDLVISTIDVFSVSGVSGGDEDLIEFSATSLGSTTSGAWSWYFDGSDVGLADTANEDVNGLWINDADGKIYLSTLGAFSVPGVSGDGSDIFICTPGSVGSNTSCTYDSNLYWDGSLNGFSGQVVDGFDVVPYVAPPNTPTFTPSPVPTNTPTNTLTNTPTRTPTSTPSGTSTSTVVYTSTHTATSTITYTATETSTNTPSFTPTRTPSLTPSSTPAPPTATNTATNTPTPINYVYPLTRGGNDRLLYDQAGQPFFWSGDSPTSLIVQLDDADVLTYLNDRQAKGFNIILVDLIDQTFGVNSPANLAGDLPFTGNSFTTPNEAYFTHVDWVIAQAAARNMTVLLSPFDVNYQCETAGCGSVNSASLSDMTWWGNYLGNRYKDFPNIIWGIGADPDSINFVPRVNAFVDSLTVVDTNHLVLGGGSEDALGTDYWSGSSWMAVNSIFTYDPALYRISKTAYDYSPPLPFFMAETGYENDVVHSVTDQRLRSDAYYSVLSGSIGYTFGNCPIWFFNSPAGAGYCDNSGSWQSNLNSSGAFGMQHAQQLFSHRHWYELVPDWDHTVIVAGYGTWGNTNYVTAAQTSDQSLMIAYLPAVQTVTIDLTQFYSPVNASWYDPTTGAYLSISGSPFANTQARLFTPPGLNAGGDGDWVLVLETTQTPPPTATPTSAFTLTPTLTSIVTSTNTATPTASFTATSTPIPPTITNTPVPPTGTATNTPVSPTATNTATNTLVPPTATRTPTNIPTAAPVTMGETNILSTDDSGNGNLLIAQQAILAQSGTLQSLSFYVATASGQLRLGVYSDNGGNPGTLLAQTAAFTPTVGWNTQNVQTSVLLPSGTYWLAYLPQSNNLHFRITFTGTARGYSYTFGTMPGTFSSSAMAADFHFSFYATLLAIPSPTSTVTNTPVLPTNTNTPVPPTATNTPVPPTATYTSTNTATATATNTLTSTATFTNTPIPPTATYTSTNTVTATATNTLTSTATFTNTPIPPTATNTSTSTATFTNTPVPPTVTYTSTTTVTSTNTTVPPTATNTSTSTATFTNTPVPPTATYTSTTTVTSTNTSVPPTATNTPTSTATFTNTPIPPTATYTSTTTVTSTNTPVPPTATYTSTNTPVPPTATNTLTSTATFTNTPIPPTVTYTSTNTPVPPTATNTPTSTVTFTNTPVPPTATYTSTNTPVPPTATNTPTNTVSPTAIVITIGETNILTTDDSGNANILTSQQAVLSQSATIQSLSFYVASANGQLRLGIYSDNNGNPGTLLAQTAAFTPTTGWNTQNVQTPVILPAGTYWLTYLVQNNNLHYRVTLNGTAKGYSYTFGVMPNTYSTSPMSGSFHWSFYATLTR